MVAIAKGSSIMAEVQHVFGEQVDGHTYHARRAVYAVIRDSEGRVATVQEHGHLWLPGGGIEGGETPEQALVREVEEECAQRLQIVEKIGEALQYFYQQLPVSLQVQEPPCPLGSLFVNIDAKIPR